VAISFNFSGISAQEYKLLDHMVLAGLVFKETPNGFPEAVLFYIPSSNA
jgi:hypothetical protein